MTKETVVASSGGTSPPDKRALKILFDTYWSRAGWNRDVSPQAALADFEHAKSKRVMFDAVVPNHVQTVSRLLELIGKVDSRWVADAFLASLSTRRLDWRSALGSYAVFHAMPDHPPEQQGRNPCSDCGMWLTDGATDLSIFNFERFKWGGTRHDFPEYAALDLELFLESEVPSPTSEDIQIFHNLLTAIAGLPPRVSSAALQAHLSKVLKSNKSERDNLVAILGYCGILATPEHPGFAEQFVPYNKRRLPDRHFVDMPYPACWWRSENGINQDRLQHYFGHVL
ncbi:MAG: hypothetical protein Q7U16_02340 [Agitococcus sp.]|nr:hypothetical protein [Agitococcus sp.]